MDLSCSTFINKENAVYSQTRMYSPDLILFTMLGFSWHARSQQLLSQVFKLANVVEGNALLHYPVLEMGINSKISSLCWNSYVKSCLLAADYEGALQLWDVSTNAVTSQFEEHSKRIWSVDFSAVRLGPGCLCEVEGHIGILVCLVHSCGKRRGRGRGVAC